jgi:hypothetical protein
MRLSVTLAAAIISAIALTTAWSISMLPRGQGCYGGNPTACFEQFNAATLGRVVPADSVGKETFRCLGYISCMFKRQPLRSQG